MWHHLRMHAMHGMRVLLQTCPRVCLMQARIASLSMQQSWEARVPGVSCSCRSSCNLAHATGPCQVVYQPGLHICPGWHAVCAPVGKGLCCCMQAYERHACRDARQGRPLLLAPDGQRCMMHPRFACQMRSACPWRRSTLPLLASELHRTALKCKGWQTVMPRLPTMFMFFADWRSGEAAAAILSEVAQTCLCKTCTDAMRILLTCLVEKAVNMGEHAEGI